MKAYPIPLPPIAEQQRIVATVSNLMELCDQLEGQLTTARSEGHRLLEAIFHHALKDSRREVDGSLAIDMREHRTAASSRSA